MANTKIKKTKTNIAFDPIEIFKGKSNGAVMQIYPLTPEDAEKELCLEFNYNEEKSLEIDEDDFELAMYGFMLKYYDKNLYQNIRRYNREYTGDSKSILETPYYEHWDINYYSYETVKRLLKDLEKVQRLLETDDCNPYLLSFMDGKSKTEVSQVCEFYKRFIPAMQKMMEDSPTCTLICFSGP